MYSRNSISVKVYRTKINIKRIITSKIFIILNLKTSRDALLDCNKMWVEFYLKKKNQPKKDSSVTRKQILTEIHNVLKSV